jgi:hypothetical protein
MSPHAANSLVHDLVQMAQAMEQLPQVREELDTAKGLIDTQAETIQRLEMKLMDRNGEIDNLHHRIRDLEVARDDAELRFLEAEERTTKALAFIRTMFGNAGSLIQDLDPPRVAEPVVQPQAEPQPTQEPVSVQSDPTTHAQSGSERSEQTSATSSASEVVTSATEPQPSGQSEPDPIASTTQEYAATPHTADHETDAPSSSPGPYHNRRYIEVPMYVSLDNWIAGGGTEENYYASRHPAPKAAE